MRRRAGGTEPVVQLFQRDARNVDGDVRHLRIGEEQAGAAVAHHARQLVRGGAGGQRRHRQARAQSAQEQQQVGNRVGAGDGNALRRPQSFPLQPGGQAIHLGVQLAPGQASGALPQGQLRGPGARVFADEVGNGAEGR